MQQVQTFQAQTVPALLPQSATRRLSTLRQAVEGEFGKLTIAEDRAPTDDERAFLVRREADLSMALKPSTEGAALAEIVAMFAAMRSKTASEDELVAVIEIYAKDVAPIPFFALQQACARFRRGEIGDGVWVPTQGELANEARQIMRDFTDERAAITRVLSAKVVQAVDLGRRGENVESVRRMAAATAAALKIAIPRNEILRGSAAQDQEPPPRFRTDEEAKRDAEDWLAAELAKPRQAVPISDALATILERQNAERKS
jgi:hypothetical protein